VLCALEIDNTDA